MTRMLCLGLLCAGLLGSCTILDVRSAENPARLESDALVNGLLSVGMPESESILVAELGRGRSPGAFVSLELWPRARLEAGVVGATVGVGPIDLGLGIGPYEPISRARRDFWDDEAQEAPSGPPAGESGTDG